MSSSRSTKRSSESNSTMATMKRVARDLEKFSADAAAAKMFHIEPYKGYDLLRLVGHVNGPPATPYEGGQFHLVVDIPASYPFKSPKVIMTTKVWHPNIDESGNICLDILGERWTPAMSICSVMMSIQALLSSPNADDALNDVAAEQLIDYPQDYEKTVLYWTYKYAIKPADRTPKMVAANAPLEDIVNRVMAHTGKKFDEALSLLSYYNWKEKVVLTNHGRKNVASDRKA